MAGYCVDPERPGRTGGIALAHVFHQHIGVVNGLVEIFLFFGGIVKQNQRIAGNAAFVRLDDIYAKLFIALGAACDGKIRVIPGGAGEPRIGTVIRRQRFVNQIIAHQPRHF